MQFVIDITFHNIRQVLLAKILQTPYMPYISASQIILYWSQASFSNSFKSTEESAIEDCKSLCSQAQEKHFTQFQTCGNEFQLATDHG